MAGAKAMAGAMGVDSTTSSSTVPDGSRRTGVGSSEWLASAIGMTGKTMELRALLLTESSVPGSSVNDGEDPAATAGGEVCLGLACVDAGADRVPVVVGVTAARERTEGAGGLIPAFGDLAELLIVGRVTLISYKEKIREKLRGKIH